MPYVYVPDGANQALGGYQAAPDRFSSVMRGNGVAQPGIPWGNSQPSQMQAMSQPVQQNSGMIWVSSRQEADTYPINPGSAVALWDANNPVVYLRQADNTGKPSTTVYDLVKHVDSELGQTNAPQIDMSKVVTWEKLEEYLAERLKRPSRAAQKKEETDNG